MIQPRRSNWSHEEQPAGVASLYVLGSAAAVSDLTHDNTHFLLIGATSRILIDCGSNPMDKLNVLGLDQNSLDDVVLTHFHPDHVSGFPNMLMQLWLLGRHRPLRVYGLDHCIDRTEDMMSAFLWDTWPNFFPVTFARVAEHDDAPLLVNDDFIITACPVRHFVPTIGLRVRNRRSGRVLAYSCDTEPVPSVLRLAHDADLLLHEAAGEGFGHSSARQAGEAAAQAGVRSLYLVHYQVWNVDPSPLADEARSTFAGPVFRLEDGDCLTF
jgi:ribonuclease Z